MDKTKVTGSELFVYTIKTTFTGIEGETFLGSIVLYFPNTINYQLPPLGNQLKAIGIEENEKGTKLTFDYQTVTAGNTVEFTVAGSFGEGRRHGDTYENTATVYQNQVATETMNAPVVSLSLMEDFIMKKTSREAGNPKVGESFPYKIKVLNNGDGGATITKLSIVDPLPTGLVPDFSFTPVGYDSSSEFADTSQDKITGTWNDTNTLEFALDNYSGTEYSIDLRAIVEDGVKEGTTITNTATFSINGEKRNNNSADITTYQDIATAYLEKIGPDYASAGGVIQYQVLQRNDGTVPLTNYIMKDTLPSEVEIEKIRCYSSESSMDSYSIYITTSDQTDQLKLVAGNLVGNSDTFDLLPFIPEGARVFTIEWHCDEVKVDTRTNYLNMWGNIKDTAVSGSTMSNLVSINANSTINSISISKDKKTLLSAQSVLEVSKSLIPDLPTYHPLSEFIIQLTAHADHGQTVNPIFADLLPVELAYAKGREYYLYYDNFNGKTYDSREENFPIPLPTVTSYDNYRNTGLTLIRFDFTGFTLQFGNQLQVHFTAVVSLNAVSSFTNTGYLGTTSNNSQVIGTQYVDSLDLDGDGNTTEIIAASEPVTGVILYTSSFSIEKWAKGNQSLEYSKSTETTAGGEVHFCLCVTNNQNAQLTNLELIDILPYIGDTSVLQENVARGSEFPLYLTEDITAEMLNILDNTTSTASISIEYSTSTDPIRFNAQGEEIGTGTWSTTPPTDLTTVAAIKVSTDDTVILNPYDRLMVTVVGVAPVDGIMGDTAYNSFAVRGDIVTTEGTSTLLPTEPEKVSITLAENNLGSIGGFVWEDIKEDGIWTEGEAGVNGVVVELYDEKKTLLAQTITADNFQGALGYYGFYELEDGNYYVKFIPEDTDSLTVQNVESSMGSRPDPETGFTSLITIEKQEQILDINAGIISSSCNPPTISAESREIALNSQFDPLTGVTATDCKGNDITSDIIVLENQVNTAVSGTYAVIYEVTDSLGQTTTLEIKVTVKDEESDPLAQSITDIMESIALEEVGIRSILDAEGAKIQKAVALDLTTEEMLAVNKSVESMVTQLTTLEEVLAVKLNLALNMI